MFVYHNNVKLQQKFLTTLNFFITSGNIQFKDWRSSVNHTETAQVLEIQLRRST